MYRQNITVSLKSSSTCWSTLQNLQRKVRLCFGYKIRGEELYFYVKDTGIGISLENQKKIFERFTKVNTFIQGTGLGLSICKNIVTKMKGRIGVESEGEGKGSTFWFTIPYKPKEAQKENNLTLMPLLNERSKEKPIILIAEDNESNYMLFKSILQKIMSWFMLGMGRKPVERPSEVSSACGHHGHQYA